MKLGNWSPGSRGVFANKEFRWFWLAGVVSFVGSWLYRVASAWLMLELTGSALWVAMMAGSVTFPVLIFAPLGGALADLRERRVVLLAAQGVMAAAAGAVALLWYLQVLTPLLLLLVGLALGVGLAVSNPAWLALISDLVAEDQIADAVALNAAGFNVSRAIGPAIGGLLVAAFGPGLPFTLNAISFAAVIVVLAWMKLEPSEPNSSGVITAIVEGIRFVRDTTHMAVFLYVAAAMAFSTAFLQALLPKLSADHLHGDAGTFGVLLGAMGVGALLGALIRKTGESKMGYAFIPVGLLGFAAAAGVVGVTTSITLALVAMIFTGVFWIWALSALLAATQLLAPRRVRGRVMSLFSLAFVGFIPLGSVASGAVAEVIGEPATYVAFSTLTALVGIFALAQRLPTPSMLATRRAPTL